jgi:hypothetical protein
LFLANSETRGTELYIQSIDGGPPVCVTPGEEGVQIFSPQCISSDGNWVIGLSADNLAYLYPTRGGKKIRVEGIESGEVPIRWSEDGRSVFVFSIDGLPAHICRIDIGSGERTLVMGLMPPDALGVSSIFKVFLSADLKTYVYSYVRNHSDLYVAEGLI